MNIFEYLDWNIEKLKFTTSTSVGKIEFTNLIATFNPSACKRLVLGCHYDSKQFKSNKNFVGAIDAAVPCTMLIRLAQILNHHLNKSLLSDYLTLQLIFFDGEESFQNGNSDDSLYGSKYLAEFWSKKQISNKQNCNFSINQLDTIETLIVLDLIGTKQPNFYSFFPNTKRLFNEFIRIGNKIVHFNYFCKLIIFQKIN